MDEVTCPHAARGANIPLAGEMPQTKIWQALLL